MDLSASTREVDRKGCDKVLFLSGSNYSVVSLYVILFLSFYL